jgi:glycosyltransferase involved in cell wall biosynthesis
MSSPLVSVIMPTFNRLDFLPAAVESLFAQTYSNWELIIADDGSGADTRAYLQTLQALPRIKLIWLEHSGKPSVVRNAALRAARGEYVAFLDSDDLWMPQKLHTQIASLRRHAPRQWSYTAFVVVDAAGKPQPKFAGHGRSVQSGWITPHLLSGAIILALPSVVVARHLLLRLGAFDEELIMCEDDELWLRLAAHSEVDGVEEPLTLIRRHTQHSGDDATAWRDRRRVFEKALRASGDAQLRAVLRRLRAEMSAGLARSQAAAAMPLSALGTLAASAPYSWRYREWRAGAARALLGALAPAPLRARVIRRLSGRRASDT